MIRINLLEGKKEAKAARAPAVSLEGAKLTGLVVGFLGLAVVLLFGHFYMLQKEATELDEQTRAAQAEKARLAQVKASVDQFEKRKQLLTKRIDIIEGLKRGQTGPVEMLASLSNSVQATNTVFLTSFENTGEKVNIEGVAASVNAVADFIGSLKRSGYFKNVEIRESYQDEKVKDATSFVFQLSADLNLPGATTSGKPPGT